MITFWIIAGIITLVVLLILIIPLLRVSQRSKTIEDRTVLNVQLTRDRLVELENDYEQARFDSSHYQAMKQELELSLARDLESAPQVQPKSPATKHGKWTALVISLCLPGLAVLVYLNYGHLDALNPSKQSAQATVSQQPSRASIEKMVDGLATRLKQNPNDPEGWFMLGRSYMVMGRYAEAGNAYAELQKLVGDQANVLLQHAQAKVMNNNGIWDKASIEMLSKAIKLEPENPTALSLAGLLAARQGNKDMAVKMWRNAQSALPADSNEYNELDNMIASLSRQEALKTNNSQASQSTPTTPPIDAVNNAETMATSIKVNVSITPDLLAKAGSDQTIFIYAQALNGPPMPIAVARKKVNELPLVVTLDDSMAMMPTRKLSNFENVRIAARISQSGSAMPASGDMQGKIEPVNTATTQSVSVVIDQIL